MMWVRNNAQAAVAAALLMFAGTCGASMGEAGAPCVPPAYQSLATSERVPADLLYAIALTESARPRARGRTLPWPWTLNISGKAYYYNSRKETYRALVEELRKGNDRVAVGLMQLYWRAQHRALRSDAWAAVDPYHNIRMGARYLRDRWEARQNWWEATGEYHVGPNGSRRIAKQYRGRVARWLKRIRACRRH